MSYYKMEKGQMVEVPEPEAITDQFKLGPAGERIVKIAGGLAEAVQNAASVTLRLSATPVVVGLDVLESVRKTYEALKNGEEK